MATRPMPEGVTSPEAWELATLVSRLDGLRRTVQQDARLGSADQRLMWLLSDHHPRTLRDIADALGLEQSTVNRQVNAALREGLVTRHRAPGRPAWQFTVTDEGLDRFRHDLDLGLGAYRAGLDAMPERDRRRFVALLARFVTEYRDANDGDR